MTVVLFANTSWYIYNFRKNLITSLKTKGYNIIVCAPIDSYSEKLIELGIQFQQIRLSQRGTGIFTELISLLQIRKILHKIQPDVLLSFTPKGNIYPALVKPRNTKQISNITGLGEVFDKKTILSAIVKILFKIALSYSDKVFFQNLEDMDTFIRNGIVNPEVAVRINGSGTDLTRFKPMPLSKFSDSKVCFLTLGRVIPQKGYDTILSLIGKFPQVLKIAEFHILGIPDNSRKCSMRLYKELKTLAQNKTIFLHDPVDDVENVINRAHCLLLPSTYNEGVPRSLIEGLACGLPIITTNWKGCRDTVIQGKNGFLVKPGSVEDLYEKILKFNGLSYEEKLRLSIESRKLAEKLFNEENIINSYLDLCMSFKPQLTIDYEESLSTSPAN